MDVSVHFDHLFEASLRSPGQVIVGGVSLVFFVIVSSNVFSVHFDFADL